MSNLLDSDPKPLFIARHTNFTTRKCFNRNEWDASHAELVSSLLDVMLSVPTINEDIEQAIKGEMFRNHADRDTRSTEISTDIDQAKATTTLIDRDNLEPSNVNIRTLSSAVQRLEEKINTNEHDLLTLQLQANQILRDMHLLKEEGRKLHDQRDFFKARLSPVRRVPGEVLAHIFSYLADEAIILPSKTSLLCIIQVCRSWRSAGLGCASLWTSLSIDAGQGFNRSSTSEPLAHLWFANAKDLPLKFSLKSPGSIFLPPSLPGILDTLLPFFHRIVDLQVSTRSINDILTVLQLPSGSLSSLETLSLVCQRRKRDSLKPIEVFNTVPRLQRVVLDIVPIKIWQFPDFAFPWGQITSLDILQVLKSSEWYTIFCQCTNLVTGRFYILNFNGFFPSNPRYTSSFSSLETLAIHFCNGNGGIGHLENLRFPALQDLSVVGGSNNIPVDSFIQTFPTTGLRRLCISQAPIEYDTLITFLTTCNSLEEIRIDIPRDLDGMLFLTLSSSVWGGDTQIMLPPTLPKLTSFTTCVCWEDPHRFGKFDFSPEEPLARLLRMWYERSLPQPQLKNVTLLLEEYDVVDSAWYSCEFSQNAKDYVTRLRSILHDCIYDEHACPTGFVLDTASMETVVGIDNVSFS